MRNIEVTNSALTLDCDLNLICANINFTREPKLLHHIFSRSSVRFCETRPQGYKTFSMLYSAEHEILNAFKYENMKKLSFFRVKQV